MDGHWLKQSIKQTWNILVDIPWNKTVLKYKSAGSWSLLSDLIWTVLKSNPISFEFARYFLFESYDLRISRE